MGHAPDWLRKPMTKKVEPMKASSFKDLGSLFHGKNAMADTGNKPRQYLADGGPVSGADVGLWERIKAGNIDEPGSEAYNRWGQGARNQMAAQDETRESTSSHWNNYKPSEEEAPEMNIGQYRAKGEIDIPTRSEVNNAESYRSEPAAKPKRGAARKTVTVTEDESSAETTRLKAKSKAPSATPLTDAAKGYKGRSGAASSGALSGAIDKFLSAREEAKKRQAEREGK